MCKCGECEDLVFWGVASYSLINSTEQSPSWESNSCSVLHENLTVLEQAETLSNPIEPDVSLPHLQEPASYPYPEPGEYIQLHPTLKTH
jgi:hypothetical protein